MPAGSGRHERAGGPSPTTVQEPAGPFPAEPQLGAEQPAQRADQPVRQLVEVAAVE
ncbi:hypothetical protein [Micromonospora sp. A200]|uniref:hypothetical protein n=1 Tax=Micromonospora sp. A200 TaxID=2940568 RepID=UPI002473B09C|nr:hypothetical protein [Micromonospora sp. A200]